MATRNDLAALGGVWGWWHFVDDEDLAAVQAEAEDYANDAECY